VPVLGVVPARLGSSRLPRKPLLSLAGEPLILWVVRRVVETGVCDRLVVATDAREIVAVVERAGFEAVLTSADHQSGTERVAEVVGSKSFSSYDVVLNVQGDEPLVAPAALHGAVARVQNGDPIGTAAGDLDRALASDPNRVKVVTDSRGRAVYFSRAPIPFVRDPRGGWPPLYRHIGLYAYRRSTLLVLASLDPTPLERAESLEQLRALEHGIRIKAVETLYESFEVNTPEDLEQVRRLLTTPTSS